MDKLITVVLGIVVIIVVAVLGGVMNGVLSENYYAPAQKFKKPVNMSPAHRRVFRELESWRSLGIDDYRYDLHIGCNGCRPWEPYKVTVRSGRVLQVTTTAKNGVDKRTDYSIEGVFRTASTSFSVFEDDWVRVEYEPTFHYPALIRIDIPEQFDQNFVYRVTNFQAK